MYSTCIFCRGPLGANREVEHFPVGRRLAFDAARGRLWVVCPRCARWNLTPLEERWEAVEECERAFRGTRIRASTGSVGLARLRGGVELVRVGEPRRGEMAVWRYGGRFAARRVREAARDAVRGAAGAVLAGAGLAAWILPRALLVPLLGPGEADARDPDGLDAAAVDRWMGLDPAEVLARVETVRPYPRELRVRRGDLERVRVLPADGARPWGLRVSSADGTAELAGEEALRAARLLLPAVNRRGAGERHVRRAVDLLDGADDAAGFFARAPVLDPALGFPLPVVELDPAVRLALEMAAHEEAERRAMRGELAALEREWRDAERIAAIADRLAVPAGVERRLRGARRAGGA
ncbi:MAG: hypothetical protein ABW277_06730 [Longimicrobiaceae bacterium]